MIRKSLFYLVLGVTAVFLLIVSFYSKNRNYAVVAEVEPQKTAISYPKPVRIKNLYVAAGEHVQKGDLLLEVERPDLELDIQKIRNEISQLEAEKARRREDYRSARELEEVRHQQQITSLNGRLDELDSEYRSDSLFMAEVTRWTGTDTVTAEEPYFIIRKRIQDEKSLEEKRYSSEKKRQQLLFEKDMEFYELRSQRLRDELESHLTEEMNLKQFSPIDGTIGAVSVQLMELIPPYQTILSVYDENPNVIKAYMNEKAIIPVEVGDRVNVESINRNYSLEGEVVEIGSRIVSYPNQMVPASQTQMWGKEVFVKIPTDNEFLNGEKVYVYLGSN
jgi:multidrug resistance efflux pump